MQPHQKAVQLRFRQGLRAHTAQRVLGGNDQMRAGQGIGLALYSDVAFFHCLQQSCLCLAGGAVDLVREEQVTEKCSRLEHECSGIFFIDRKACQVGGQHVRRKLYPTAVQPQSLGKRHGKGGFPDTGHVLHQHVSACQKCKQYFRQNEVFSDNSFLHLPQDRGGECTGCGNWHNFLLFRRVCAAGFTSFS